MTDKYPMRGLFYILIFLTLNAQAYERPARASSRSSSGSPALAYGLAFGTTLNTPIQFNDWETNGPSGHVGGFANLRFASAYFVDLRVGINRKSALNAWLGVRYYAQKKQYYRSTRGGNGANVTTIDYSGSDVPQLQTTEIYFSGLQRSDSFYAGAGLGYSFQNYREASTYPGQVSAQGGFSYHATAGWYFFDNTADLSFSYRRQTIKLTFDDKAGTVDTYNGGTAEFLEVMLGFIF